MSRCARTSPGDEDLGRPGRSRTCAGERPGAARADGPRRVRSGGGGGLVSTVDDLAAFGGMLLAGGAHGGRRVLARPTVEAMTTNQLTPAQLAAGGEIERMILARRTINARVGDRQVEPGARNVLG